MTKIEGLIKELKALITSYASIIEEYRLKKVKKGRFKIVRNTVLFFSYLGKFWEQEKEIEKKKDEIAFYFRIKESGMERSSKTKIKTGYEVLIQDFDNHKMKTNFFY